MEVFTRDWLGRLARVLIALGALHAGTAMAQAECVGKYNTADMAAERGQLWKLLQDRQFDKLDAELLDRQHRYERGAYTEELLVNAYGTFR